jgi:hypothetical protein
MPKDGVTNQRSHERRRKMPRAPTGQIEQAGVSHARCEERFVGMLSREHGQETCRDTDPFALRRA